MRTGIVAKLLNLLNVEINPATEDTLLEILNVLKLPTSAIGTRVRVRQTLAFGSAQRTIYTVPANKTFRLEGVSMAARATRDVTASTLLFETSEPSLIEPFSIQGEEIALSALSVVLGATQSGINNEQRRYDKDPESFAAGTVLRFTPSDATDVYAAVIWGYLE